MTPVNILRSCCFALNLWLMLICVSIKMKWQHFWQFLAEQASWILWHQTSCICKVQCDVKVTNAAVVNGWVWLLICIVHLCFGLLQMTVVIQFRGQSFNRLQSKLFLWISVVSWRPIFTYRNAHRKPPLEIHFAYLVNKEIYFPFLDVLCNLRFIIHKIHFCLFFVQIIPKFFVNCALKFEYPPQWDKGWFSRNFLTSRFPRAASSLRELRENYVKICNIICQFELNTGCGAMRSTVKCNLSLDQYRLMFKWDSTSYHLWMVHYSYTFGMCSLCEILKMSLNWK